MMIRPGMEEDYKKGYNNNLDEYGHAIYTFAEHWAELMENDMKNTNDPSKTITENAEILFEQAGGNGITGFMYGCVVSILAHCWEYGEILRKWHNKEYNYEGDGVVNPAIITLGYK